MPWNFELGPANQQCLIFIWLFYHLSCTITKSDARNLDSVDPRRIFPKDDARNLGFLLLGTSTVGCGAVLSQGFPRIYIYMYEEHIAKPADVGI